MRLKHCAVILLGLSALAPAQEMYKGRLSPLPSDAKSRPDVNGVGSVSAVLTGTKLSVTGSFEGLRTAGTIARIHDGVATGVRGPAIHDLTASKATSGTITGTVELTATEVEHLKKGRLYVQIYSEKPADGTLWGWLLR
jgi:hypothetical protein